MITLEKEHVGRILYSRGKMGDAYGLELVPFRVVAVGPTYASIEWVREGCRPIPEKLHRVTGQTQASRKKHGDHSSFGRKFYESVEQYNAKRAAERMRVRVGQIGRDIYLSKISHTVEELEFLEKALTEPGFLAGKLEELKK